MKEPMNPLFDLFLGGFWVGFGISLAFVGVIGCFFWLLRLPFRVFK